MSREITRIPTPIRRQRARENLLVLVTEGGGKLALNRYAHLWQPAAVLQVDVLHELLQSPLPLRSQAFHQQFALAEGQTADMLFANAPPELRNLVQSLGAMNAANGLGQIRGAGAQATQELVNSPAFNEYTRRLVDHLIIHSGGRPRQVGIRGLASEAGGVGSAGLVILVEALCRAISSMQLCIEVDFDFIGEVTFTGHGARIGANTAACTVTLLHYLFKNRGGKHLSIARSLSLVEFPPTGFDAELRNRLIVLDEQALASVEMQAFLRRLRPNAAFNGALGAVTLRQLALFDGLDPATEVAPQVADAYQLECSIALDAATACTTLVSAIEARSSCLPGQRESLEVLVESSLPVDELLQQVKTPGGECSYHVVVRTSLGGEYPLAEFRACFGIAPTSLREAEDMLRLQRSIAKALREEIAGLQSDVTELDADIQAYEDTIAEEIDGSSWLRFRSQKSSKRRLLAAAQRLRAFHDERLDKHALLRVLTRGYEDASHEADYLASRLGLLRDTLASHRLRGEHRSPVAYCQMRSIDEAFPEIIDLARLPRDQQREVLCAQVSVITEEGLAHAVRADWPRVESIADRIVFGEAAIEGPSIGGKSTTEPTPVVYVLPPMLPHLREALRRRIGELTDGALVVCSDEASAGLNVVRYRFRSVTSIEELFCGRLRRQLYEMLNDPLVSLYGVADKARELGIRCEEGDVVFTPMASLIKE